jgi:hypothetical protein
VVGATEEPVEIFDPERWEVVKWNTKGTPVQLCVYNT